MEAVQFIQITPEQLKEQFSEVVQSQINELKKHFQPKAPTEYLTRREVANLLGVNLTTLNNWTRKGILKSYGIGGRVYYKRNEVESAVIELKN
ncbi:helix-turn-helix domain-containing protein [Capnocytophaga stomatis]|uniref:helix-turn-helix domain-containing protein n=1 Tax=Capnocytophaga stomatis TaxID=1848904 RepID=UPI00385C9462